MTRARSYVTTYDLLAEHPFLAGMSRENLERLAPWGNRWLFQEGARVFSEGGRADRFWLIRDGEVRLDTQVPGRGREVVETLGPGSVLGWSWLFPPYRWQFGATAVRRTLTVEMDGPGIRRMCAEDPRVGYELYRRFMQVVVNRLQATRQRLLDLSQPPA